MINDHENKLTKEDFMLVLGNIFLNFLSTALKKNFIFFHFKLYVLSLKYVHVNM